MNEDVSSPQVQQFFDTLYLRDAILDRHQDQFGTEPTHQRG